MPGCNVYCPDCGYVVWANAECEKCGNPLCDKHSAQIVDDNGKVVSALCGECATKTMIDQ